MEEATGDPPVLSSGPGLLRDLAAVLQDMSWEYHLYIQTREENEKLFSMRNSEMIPMSYASE